MSQTSAAVVRARLDRVSPVAAALLHIGAAAAAAQAEVVEVLLQVAAAVTVARVHLAV